MVYMERHNSDASIVFREVWSGAQQGLEIISGKKVVLNQLAKIPWEFPIQPDTRSDYNRPDIILIDYTQKTALTIDVTLPRDENVKEEEQVLPAMHRARKTLGSDDEGDPCSHRSAGRRD